MSSSLIGKSLGNYKIVDTLGKGGMAAVYLGYQESVDRQVAVKILPPHPGLDANFVERFQLEARTIARLQHPHILPLYDYGTQDDIVYLVMAYADGGTLDDYVVDGPMPLPLVEKFLREIAGALDYAHRRGVIHRDIKPGNILMDGEGHALLADFGIVKLAEGGTNLTGTGVVGTPAYMAPEQAQGAPIDARADIYSLGVVVYQMLTGKQPFTADTVMQVMIKVIQEPAPSILTIIPNLPPALGEVMDRVLAKDPDDRYQTATEFAEDFSVAVYSNGANLQDAKDNAVLEPSTRPQPTAFPKPTMVKTPKKDSIDSTAKLPGVDTGSGTGTQTVIVHQGTNPLLLLGGFALIAVAMVVVVLLVISSVNNNGEDDDAEATNAAEIALQQTQQAIPTHTPAPQVTAVPNFGSVSYSTDNALGDAFSVRVDGLRAPGSGQVYAAWLLNTAQDTFIYIGEFRVDPLGNGAISFTDAEGRLLPAHYNAIAVTLEESGSIGDTPSDEIVYSGFVPEGVSNALYEIFVTSPDGLGASEGEAGGSLLEGITAEAATAAQHAGLAAGSTTIGAMHLHAEHTINILNGASDDYDGNGRGENPGRGVGVFAFLDLIETKLVDAVSVPEASRSVQSNAEFIRVCLENTRIRANRVIELEQELLAADTIESVQDQAAESTQVMAELQTGIDLNESGQIEAFEGECGLDQITTFGILVGSLEIIEGGLE